MKITKEWLEKQNACHNSLCYVINRNMLDQEAPDFIRDLIDHSKLDWANWTICRVFNEDQRVKYAVFAAEQVYPLWKDKHPKEAAIWRKWVDSGCPKGLAVDAAYVVYAVAAATYAAYVAAVAADAAADAAYVAYAVAAAEDAAADAASAANAKKKMLLKILEYGLKLLEEGESDMEVILDDSNS